jgi:hypothetical protein
MGKKLQILVLFKRIAPMVLLYFWGLFLGGGCQRQAANLVQNSAPLASAGPTQNVISGQVVVLDGSASLDPTGESLQYLWVQTAGVPGRGLFLSAITVDTAGTGYITDMNQNAIYEYDQITTRGGLIAPDRTIQGLDTSLNGPNAVFLLE